MKNINSVYILNFTATFLTLPNIILNASAIITPVSMQLNLDKNCLVDKVFAMGLMVALAGNTRKAKSASYAAEKYINIARNDSDESVAKTNRLVIINVPSLIIIDTFDF